MWPFIIMGIFGLFAVGRKSRKSNFDNYVSRAMAVIRKLESGNNYQAQNDHSSASGAYQFLDTTWGGFGGYDRAYQAPPNVQDGKAQKLVTDILASHGYNIVWVPAVWYAGSAGAVKYNWDTVLPGNRSSIKQYVNKWMAEFAKA